VSWRISGVLDIVNRFIPRRSVIGKSRVKKKHPLSIESGWTTSSPPAKFTPADVCDDLFSIRGLLLQDERTELEKLFEEIDEFSQRFKSAGRQRCNV